jgi:hypothetical protein
MNQFFGNAFKVIVVILTVSGFLWFTFNDLAYKYPKARKIVFWYFGILFIFALVTAILAIWL